MRHSFEQHRRGGAVPSTYVRSQAQMQAPLTVNTSFASQSSAQNTSQGLVNDSGSVVEESDTPCSVKYRNDYSRAQHPEISSSVKAALPMLSTENLSLDKVRFEKYVNRFAVHDPLASPPARRPQTMSERIGRFNTPPSRTGGRPSSAVGAGPRHFTYPDPEPQSQVIGSSASDVGPPSLPLFQDQIPSTQLSNRDLQSRRYQSINGSQSTVTTATNTSNTTEPQHYGIPSTPERRFKRPQNPSSAPHPRVGQRSQSYDVPETPPRAAAVKDQSIETPSPARVRELRSRLWDNNETLQVSVRPSLSYGGGQPTRSGRSSPAVPKQPQVTRRALTTSQDKVDRSGGHRSTKSLSPARPQYRTSQFRSRFIDAAALANRRPPPQQQQQPSTPERRQETIPERAVVHDRVEHVRSLHEAKQMQDERAQKREEEAQALRQIQELAESMRNSSHQPPTQAPNTWRREQPPATTEERSEVISDTTGLRSDGTSEASVSKLLAKLHSVSRKDPAIALAQIDSILKAESDSASGRSPVDPDDDRYQLRTAMNYLQEEKKMEDDGDHEHEDESDDETSVSSITNPTYACTGHGVGSLHSRELLNLENRRRPKPNVLQAYQHLPSEDAPKRKSKKDPIGPPPVDNIKVKGQNQGQNQGPLDRHVSAEASKDSGTSPASIALKIRMWDELSAGASKSSRRQEEDGALSAATEDLGSIVTPATSGTVKGSKPVSPRYNGISTSLNKDAAQLRSSHTSPQDRSQQQIPSRRSPDTTKSPMQVLESAQNPPKTSPRDRSQQHTPLHCLPALSRSPINGSAPCQDRSPASWSPTGNELTRIPSGEDRSQGSLRRSPVASRSPMEPAGTEVPKSNENSPRQSPVAIVSTIDLSGSEERLRGRGREISRASSNESPPRTSNQGTESSLTPRRRHPWDHHHPRNRSSSETYRSIGSGSDEGSQQLQPPEDSQQPQPPQAKEQPQPPQTSPHLRSVNSVKEVTKIAAAPSRQLRFIDDNTEQQGDRENRQIIQFAESAVPPPPPPPPPQSTELSKPKAVELLPQDELSTRPDVSNSTSGGIVRNSSPRSQEMASKPDTNVVPRVGILRNPSPRNQDSLPKPTAVPHSSAPRNPRSNAQDEWEMEQQRSDFAGDEFEVDPMLLNSNDDFGMPPRVKRNEPEPIFFGDFDAAAWTPLHSDPFASVSNMVGVEKKSDPPASTNRYAHPSRVRPFIEEGISSFLPNPVVDTVSHSGRSSPHILQSYERPPLQKDEEQLHQQIGKSPGRRKFNFLKKKKNRDDIIQLKYDSSPSNSYAMDSILQTQRSKSQSPGRRRASDSRTEKSGGVFQRFRIRRSLTADSLTEDTD